MDAAVAAERDPAALAPPVRADRELVSDDALVALPGARDARARPAQRPEPLVLLAGLRAAALLLLLVQPVAEPRGPQDRVGVADPEPPVDLADDRDQERSRKGPASSGASSRAGGAPQRGRCQCREPSRSQRPSRGRSRRRDPCGRAYVSVGVVAVPIDVVAVPHRDTA